MLRCVKINLLAFLRAFCATRSQLRLHETTREPFLAPYDCRLAHPTPSDAPSGASPKLAGCSSCEEL